MVNEKWVIRVFFKLKPFDHFKRKSWRRSTTEICVIAAEGRDGKRRRASVTRKVLIKKGPGFPGTAKSGGSRAFSI